MRSVVPDVSPRAMRSAELRASLSSSFPVRRKVGRIVYMFSGTAHSLLVLPSAFPEGFEPPASWFVAKRSIQLSYGNMCSCVEAVCETRTHHLSLTKRMPRHLGLNGRLPRLSVLDLLDGAVRDTKLCCKLGHRLATDGSSSDIRRLFKVQQGLTVALVGGSRSVDLLCASKPHQRSQLFHQEYCPASSNPC